MTFDLLKDGATIVINCTGEPLAFVTVFIVAALVVQGTKVGRFVLPALKVLGSRLTTKEKNARGPKND